MNRKVLLLLLIFTLLMPLILAEPEQYLFPGVSRDSSYQQDGTGKWLNKDAMLRSFQYTQIQSYFPLVGDTDGDLLNEIVILADNDMLFLNYSSGAGFKLEDSVSHGNCSLQSLTFRPTPALFDADSDNISNIISWNGSHMINTEWNGTAYVQVNAAETSAINTTPYTAIKINANPVIKCIQGLEASTGKDTCFFQLQNRTASDLNYVMVVYNVDDNTITYSIIMGSGAQNYQGFPSMHLADGDNDGFTESYTALRGSRLMYVTMVDDAGNNKSLFSYDMGETTANSFSDIIVNNFDGSATNGLEISYGISDDGVNYDMATNKATDGSVVKSSYCSLVSCPEGTSMSLNVFQPMTSSGYIQDHGDVCIYVRNPSQSYPGIDEDTIYCISRYGSESNKQTVVSNTYNFTGSLIVHDVPLFGSYGLLTNAFGILEDNKQSKPSFNDAVNIPVDYSKSGSLDVIGMNASHLYYYDDNALNYNYDIKGISYTPSPLCLGYTYTYDIILEDEESDAGSGYVSEYYPNGTVNSNVSVYSLISPFVSAQTSYYYADELGQFSLNFNFKDLYHSVYDTEILSFLVINNTPSSGTCNSPEMRVNNSYVGALETNATSLFHIDTENLFNSLGLTSLNARTIVTLMLIIFLAVGVYIKTKNTLISVGASLCGLLMSYYLELIGILPIFVIIVLASAIAVYRLTGTGTQ